MPPRTTGTVSARADESEQLQRIGAQQIVGVGKLNELASGGGQAGIARGRRATVTVLTDDPHSRVARRKLIENLAGTVCRCVVDANHLKRA